jgi:hypothetical protein
MDLSALPHFLDAKGDPLFSNQWGAILNHQLLEALASHRGIGLVEYVMR